MGVFGGLKKDTWLYPAVKIFIKMKSGWSESVAWGQTTVEKQNDTSVLLKYPYAHYK